jgi:hypothetical protein
MRTRARKITMVGLLVGVGALAIGGALGAVFFKEPPVRTSTTTTAPTTTTTLPPVANLGDVGKELGELVEAGRHVDYAAVYGVTDKALPEGLVQTVELWRKGKLFRSDIVERNGAGTRRQSAISGGSVARSCETVNGNETCRTIDSIPGDLPQAFIRAIVTAKTPPKLTVKDGAVSGYEARCFEAAGIGELCLAGDGTMLRLVLKGAIVELTHIDDKVPDSAFDNAG